MTTRWPTDIIEEVAFLVVSADIDDTKSFEELQTLLRELKDELPDGSSSELTKNIRLCLSDLTKLRKGTAGKKPEAALQRVAGRIEAIQQAVNLELMSVDPDASPPASKDAPVEEDEPAPDAKPSVTVSEDVVEKGVKPAVELADGQKPFVLPAWVDDEVFKEFLANQVLVINDIEGDILELDGGAPRSAEASLRRRLHTLKGEAGVLGLDMLEELCHATEDLLEVRLEASARVDLLLGIKDWVESALESYAEGIVPPAYDHLLNIEGIALEGDDEPDATATESALAPEAGGSPPPPSPAEEDGPEPPAATESGGSSAPEDVSDSPQENILVERHEDDILMLGEFLQESTEGLAQADQLLMEAEQDAGNPEVVDGLFRVFHTIKGVAGFLDLEYILSLAHTTETLLNQVREGNASLEEQVLDSIFDATDLMRMILDDVRDGVENHRAFRSVPGLTKMLESLQALIDGRPPEPAPLPVIDEPLPLCEVLEITASIPKEVVKEALETQETTGRKLGAELVAQGAVKPKQVSQSLRVPAASRKARIRETIKVDLERVDRLVETIGELVIVESMVINAPEFQSVASLRARNYLGQLSKITRDLQDMGMRMRMVPVRTLFQKMARMVRDLSRSSGKKIQFSQTGEGTEMDRSMVEQLADPLVHMIRNAADHGIEPESERVVAGKLPEGSVTLSAYHEGGSIVIELVDDGRGLRRDVILAKAIKKGLVSGGADLTDSEVFALIFAPGFSTAETVTEISGRGVGMDVVRRNIEAMRGRVSIESTPGEGTTFKIVLPLTLAIIDGMLVACGHERYIIPTLSIVESFQPNSTNLVTHRVRHELINMRGQIFPMYRMSGLLDVEGAKADPTEALVVVVESAGRRMGLLVDDVVAQQQVVIKSMGSGLEKLRFISGAAILSDGHVGLILNVDEVSELVDLPADELPRVGDQEAQNSEEQRTGEPA